MIGLYLIRLKIRRFKNFLRWARRIRIGRVNIVLCSVLITSLCFNYNYYKTTQSSCKEGSTNLSSSLQNKTWNKFNDDYMEFIVNNEGICSEVSDKNLILMMVSTARYNFEARQAIRETWGSVLEHDVVDPANGSLTTWHFRLIFTVGLPLVTEGPFHKRQLEEESRIFSDIIMGNFTDTYRNLTYKHLLGYKWVLNYCPTAQIILKTDDDVFVNVDNVVNFLHKIQKYRIHKGEKYRASVLICNENVGQPAERHELFKTRVTVEEWPEVEFPTYCTGFGYLATAAVIPKLYSFRHQVKFLYIEDVFVTGVIRAAYNRNLTRKNPNYIHIGNLEKQIIFYEQPEEKTDEDLTGPLITGVRDREIAIKIMCKIWKLSLAEYYSSPEGQAMIRIAQNRTLLCT